MWLAYFEDAWRLNERLFGAICPAAFEQQPDPLRHPLIFYYGHTAAFYINKLVLAGLLPSGVAPHLELLLEKGVDPARAVDLDKVEGWPKRETVCAYRKQVHHVVRSFIEGMRLDPPIARGSPLWALPMAIEHARIHFETSSVLLRQLPPAQLQRPADWSYAPIDGPPPARRWIRVPRRQVVLGRPAPPSHFGWDNEFGHLAADVPAFEATAHLVSNHDFDAFWRDGGYTDQRLWTSQGWRWRQQLAVTSPRFWIERGDAPPGYRAMFDELDMPWSWPVEVNGFEAQAFCNWVGDGARLPREVEWAAIGHDAPLLDGDVIEHAGYNLTLRFGSPTPVNHLPEGRSALGFHDVFGNVWQWFADDFRPLPGFAPHPLYADFSSPYFTQHHAAMAGGSWASTGTSASRHYRLWFRRRFYQHAGFRMARSLD